MNLTIERAEGIVDDFMVRVGLAGSLNLPLWQLRPWLRDALLAACAGPIVPDAVARPLIWRAR